MTNTDCPRFHSCNASVCPLDPNWRDAEHLPNEGVCYYALESGKAGADDYHANDDAFSAVKAALPEVFRKHPDIRRRVERASKTGSRGANLRQNTPAKPFFVDTTHGHHSLGDSQHVPADLEVILQ